MTLVWPGYFADPFVLRLPEGGYAAYGTAPVADRSRVFECLTSPDLLHWTSAGCVLEGPGLGDEYWAPEVAHRDDAWWLYYSVGRGIDGHHLRVARADRPLGPFEDVGVSLTPTERFAIDAHPFRDDDGRWYLFFARDVLDDPRPGTHLAVASLDSPTAMGPVRAALAPNADWQLYERDRSMYGGRYDWHTLEGPTVVHRGGTYWMTYSGGAWTGAGYAASWARAPHPLGPWTHAPDGAAPLLASGDGLVGPGHNSITTDEVGDVVVFHAWDGSRTRRQMHARRLIWTSAGPQVGPEL